MGTHAGALGIALFAYIYARKHRNDPKYTFGTGKVSVLGGFSSAVVLLVIAILVAFQSIERFISPTTIRFDEAIFVAGVGLAVNLFSAFLLQGHHEHNHGHHDHQHHDHQDVNQHEHHHEHTHNHHQDHNLRAAYLHVLADALTSVFAIVALLTGKAFGWIWMDALMGVVGAILITRWSLGLLHDTSQILLDASPIDEIRGKVKDLLEADADNRICDMHVWWVGPNQFAAVISLVTQYPKKIEDYKKMLSTCEGLAHVTVEVNEFQNEPGSITIPLVSNL
jgi:cation diffusion facilitator family transporter